MNSELPLLASYRSPSAWAHEQKRHTSHNNGTSSTGPLNGESPDTDWDTWKEAPSCQLPVFESLHGDHSTSTESASTSNAMGESAVYAIKEILFHRHENCARPWGWSPWVNAFPGQKTKVPSGCPGPRQMQNGTGPEKPRRDWAGLPISASR